MALSSTVASTRSCQDGDGACMVTDVRNGVLARPSCCVLAGNVQMGAFWSLGSMYFCSVDQNGASITVSTRVCSSAACLSLAATVYRSETVSY
jgi:hypothetical protein